MLIGTKGRYALQALIDIVEQDDSRPVPLTDIAARQGISLTYLEQIFKSLREKEVVISVRGFGAGYKLNQKPQLTTILSVLEAVGEKAACAQSPEQLNKPAQQSLHNFLSELQENTRNFLAGTTLTDLCHIPEGLEGQMFVLSAR